jgi:endonuclease YncB( thermonuclease family)
VAANDLLALNGTPASSQSGTLCGVDVAANVLLGTVTAVHDGDTLTLNVAGTSYKVRLDSIDAPELAQPFGSLSQVALANAVLGSSVQVAYAQTDQFGRIVGAVFDNTCHYVNLNQVATGMAWFYQTYQCEVSLAVRQQLAQAQSSAQNAKIGLWSQTAPTAPWFYRNGTDPVVPTCASSAAVWPGNPAPVTTPTATVPSAYNPVNGCFKVWVNAYVRSDGTHVNGYWRNSPGCP